MSGGVIPTVFNLKGNELKADSFSSNVQDSITATASGNQATAYQLTAFHSRVTTVGSATDSVVAPYAAKIGRWFFVTNSAGSNALQLFGIGSDTINGAAAATGVAVAAGKTAMLKCFTDGAWIGPVALA